jgi:hypothetical protein
MQSRLNITLGSSTKVGTLALTQPDLGFNAVRTAFGFRTEIPAIVNFSSPGTSSLVLDRLRVTFSFESQDQKPIEIGTAEHTALLKTPINDLPITLRWDWTAPQLAFYERLRNGREIKFSTTMSGNVHYILDGRVGQEPLSMPQWFQSHGGIVYPKTSWTKMLRDLNLRDAILVEIPFPSNVPKGWESVWAALREARDCFDQGGTSGWNGCVGRVRLALERWRKINGEAEDLAGWNPPPSANLRTRSKQQRYDVLRWHLIQCAHLAPHMTAANWTRDDALVAISALCSLLAVRNP